MLIHDHISILFSKFVIALHYWERPTVAKSNVICGHTQLYIAIP